MLFSFTGRLNRAPYWLATLGLVGAGFVLILVNISVRSAVAIVVAGPSFVLMIWITLALIIKRLHDRNKSAWCVLLFYFAPLI